MGTAADSVTLEARGACPFGAIFLDYHTGKDDSAALRGGVPGARTVA